MTKDISTGPQTATSTGAITGTLDTSGFTPGKQFSITVECQAFTPAGTDTEGNIAGTSTAGVDVIVQNTAPAAATVLIEDTAAGDFSDATTIASFTFTAPIGTAHQYGKNIPNAPPVRQSIMSFEAPPRIAAANCKLRARVSALSGSSPSITIYAFADGF